MAKNMFDLDDELLNDNKKNYSEELKKANIFCIRERFDRALEIYNQILEEDLENEEAYVGLLRAHSKNFSVFDGEEIERDIRVIEKLFPDIMNEEYATYYGNRSKYLNNKNPKNETKEEAKKKEEKPTKSKTTKVKESKSSKTTSKKQTSAKKKETKPIDNLLTSDIVKDMIKANPNMKEFEITNKYSYADIDCLEALEGTKVNKLIFKAFPKDGSDYDYCCCLEEYGLPKTIKTIEIKGSCQKIPEVFFDNIEADIKYIIDEGILAIGNYAFSNSNVKEIIIPSSVLEIGIGAFSGCKQLKKVDMEKSRVKELNDYTFLRCCSLEEIRLPYLTNMGEYSLIFADEDKTKPKQCKIYIDFSGKKYRDVCLLSGKKIFSDSKYYTLKLTDDYYDW